MAKIKFGMMMTDARGKLGGQVFSKNRGGAYIRTKVTPSNPRTSEQQSNRSLLGALSQGWSALDENERTSWNTAVSSWVTSNIFGDTVTPSGKNLYVKLNKNLASADFATVTVAPAKIEMPILAFETVAIDISASEILLVNAPVPAGFKLVVGATPSLTAGTYNFKNRIRSIYVSTQALYSEADLYDAYTSRFGIPVPGANIHFEVKIVADNGQLSVPEIQKATVTA